jgi:hypothetical protein
MRIGRGGVEIDDSGWYGRRRNGFAPISVKWIEMLQYVYKIVVQTLRL